MNNDLQIFNSEFGEVRVLTIDNEPWFVGKDVAMVLGYTDISHTILDHVDEEDRVNSKAQGHFDPELGQRGSWLINESGVYSLIFGSKLPQAKAFKRWVTSEVLPTIRKTGSYKTPTSQQERLEVMKKNSIAREANLWLRIAQNTSNGTYKEICNAYAANTLAGREVFELPKATEKTYSATEIGKMLGVSKQKIGILSNENDMKCDEYGSWFHDKSPYSGKEVEAFRYNSKAIEKFRSLLKGGAQA